MIKRVLYFFFIFCLSDVLYPQTLNPRFEKIPLGAGLPNSTITCIQQDYLGYLWIGTENGLVKYDGYTMTVFKPATENEACISDRGIVKVFEDKNKDLWIGTLNGLNKLNRADETFIHYKNIHGDSNSINSNSIQCFFEDYKGRFWIGTDKGLNLFDRENEVFTKYDFIYKDSQNSQSSKPINQQYGINAIIGDEESNNLLIGTDKEGLWKFNINQKIFSKFKINYNPNPDHKIGFIQSFRKSANGILWMISDHTLTSLNIQTGEFKSYFEFPKMNDNIYESKSYASGNIIEDQRGIIWFGFVDNEEGVFYLDQKTGNFGHHQLNPTRSMSLFNNRIFSIYSDHSGIVWAGTLDRGLWKFDISRSSFQILKHDAEDLNTISNSEVYDIISDHRGYIWFATRDALDKYSIEENKFTHYLENDGYLTHNRYRIVLDKSGDIWIGSSRGLVRFNPANETFNFFANDPNKSPNLIGKLIFRLLQDHLGYLWIATVGSGLYKYDIIKNKLTVYKHNPNDSTSLHDDQIRKLYEDHNGIIWVGTNYGGINRFDRRNETFTNFGLISPMAVHEDNYGNFWVVDYFTGLNLLDRSKNKILENYTQKDGLPHTEIIQILEDNSGNLWLGTINGLSKFDIMARTFKNYFIEDGLPDNYFLNSKPAMSNDGRMYFGTKGGILAFYADEIKDDSIPPQIVISKVSLINKPDEKLNQNEFISELKELFLPYNHNDLRFDFVGLHYGEPKKNKYKYMLDNYDKNWIAAGTQRDAAYTNLEPGEYIFRVTASNRDGIWNNKTASIKIIINSPWWQTGIAYIIYILIVIGIIYFFWRMQLRRMQIKHDFEMSNLEAEKLHELDEIKAHFFTNISHEFRTPLTLILGPIQRILNKTDNENIREDANLIYRSAKKLNKLANQLLDLSRIEAGKMDVKYSKYNLTEVVKENIAIFKTFAEMKNISLNLKVSENPIIIYLDKDKTDKILGNILSNALKFTQEGGQVNIEIIEKTIPKWRDPNIQSKKEYVEIIVSDSGIGIPKEKQDKIFDRFYQVDNNLSKGYEGTGIGLSLTKELIELQKGKITVESEEGKGTTFRVFLPLGKDHVGSQKIKPKETNNIFNEEAETSVKLNIHIDSKVDKILNLNLLAGNGENPLLLIVEDNDDVRKFIKSNLQGMFRVNESIDGLDGFDKSVKILPDLIISDVMMPKMDGFEMCKRLKSDEKTSHIPIILLTAKATTNDKIEGFEIGADEYIMKPFEFEELKARIINLLEQRKRIHEHYRKFGLFELDKQKISSVDQKFISKAMEIIKKNLSNFDFSIEKFADSMAVSKSLLHKKFIALIGEPPGELIKRIRLNKAAELLKNDFGNITEISFEVGFNDPSYFSECFKKQFGVSPSHYHLTKN